MKKNRKAPNPAGAKPNSDQDPLWVKTPFANLVRYVPSGSYFARIKVKGKLVRHLVQFLAFGGFRKSAAAAITWADCDFAKGEIIVRGDPATGTKNWDVRRGPMIPDMRKLLERLQPAS